MGSETVKVELKKIVIVTSGQPSANPRLVKEATALAHAGYFVRVVYCPLSPWADRFDDQLFQKHPEINWVKAGYHFLQEGARYKLVRLRTKLFNFLFRFVPFVSNAAENSAGLFGNELKIKAKAI